MGSHVRHLSVRVPWHDKRWDGTICAHPSGNEACLALPRNRETRRDDYEDGQAGTAWSDLDPAAGLPPCARERGNFMSDRDLTVMASHPYRASSKAHEHLGVTPMRIPAFSAGCVPFRWMLRKQAIELAEEQEIPYHDELEERARELIGFDSAWVQDGDNQGTLLDTFFGHIKPETSLCLFYAKGVPFSEEGGRVLIGAGRVLSVGDKLPYKNSDAGPFKTLLWERMVQHSIREGFADGFLLPYHEILEAAGVDPQVVPAEFVATVPGEAHAEFSYASEHVSNDSAIAALIACKQVLERASESIPGSRSNELGWINDRLGDLWRMRGPAPGLGAALEAFGVERATLVVHEIAPLLTPGEDPWPLVEKAFSDPASVGPELREAFTPTLRQKWAALPDARRALLKLLARCELTGEQAERFYQPTAREAAGIDASDEDLLGDPYRMYLLDRQSAEPIAVSTMDRGMFPDHLVREAHPVPAPSAMSDALDERRARGLLTSCLEAAAKRGDTLRLMPELISQVRGLPLDPPCPIDEDQIAIQDYAPAIAKIETAAGKPALQLERLRVGGSLIRDAVNRRLGGKPNAVDADWRALLDEELPVAEDEGETRARLEKAAALEVLAHNRFSVLVGQAGTGKTTILKVLCSVPAVKHKGVLLLAPTGKARVRMSQLIDAPAKTVAQFLNSIGRYDSETGQFSVTGGPGEDGYGTVIVDESSMLTEEQMAALIDGLRGVHRLVLVGDPRQLPPIGSGRPFLDIVTQLEPDGIENIFPRSQGPYAELTVPRRPTAVGGGETSDAGARADLLLASWFTGKAKAPGADEIWDQLCPPEGGWLREVDSTLRIGTWANAKDLHGKLHELLAADLDLGKDDEERGFARSLGGIEYNGYVYFSWEKNPNEPGSARAAESWQILSPIRGQAFGVRDLNRFIQRSYRAGMLEYANRPPWQRKVPKPMGPEEIVYGDKVINVENHRHKDVFPRRDGGLEYVANGEIGIAVGQWKTKKMKSAWKLQVEFSSQPGVTYGFNKRAFRDETTPQLELAYAITVHKSQGSEFGDTYLVIPDPCPLLSREMLYTALTRQRRRITLLYQGGVGALRAFSGPDRSEAAGRLTNLFSPPKPVQVESRFLEDRLIHRTDRGDLVRSKSEVIIANMLHAKRIDYAYERKLVAVDGGSWRYPDFTIDDTETGETVYWEHLGMLADTAYRQRWERKLAWYREQGILPVGENGDRVADLLVTMDDDGGGIDSAAIADHVKKLFGR